MTTPAGWYPDPSGAPGQRYWDGRQWTAHSAPAAPAIPPAPPKVPMTAKSKVLLGVVIAVVIGMVGLQAYLQSDEESKADQPATAQSSAGVIGSEVRDGKFAFVVDSVERQTNWYGEPKPRGQWVIASVSITNIGNEPQSFFVSNQKLIDSAGREYAADGTAAIYMDQESMAIDLGPGLSLTVKIPFDVPPGATLSSLVLHDSAFSSGVTVSI